MPALQLFGSGGWCGGIGIFEFGGGGGEVGEEGGIGEGLDAVDDALGEDLCAFPVGVGGFAGWEEFVGFGLAELFVLVGDEGVEGDEEGAALFGGLLGPEFVGVGLAVHFAVGPGFVGDHGAEDGCGAFGFGLGDVLAHVPAVGVDGFFFAGRGGTLDGFIAVAFDGGAVAEVIGFGWAGVVVGAELHDDEVSGLKFGEDFGPHVGGFHEGAGGGSADGIIFDGDFGEVEVGGEDVPPAPLVLGAGIAAVFDGGVANEVAGGVVGGGLGVGDEGREAEGCYGDDECDMCFHNGRTP